MLQVSQSPTMENIKPRERDSRGGKHLLRLFPDSTVRRYKTQPLQKSQDTCNSSGGRVMCRASERLRQTPLQVRGVLSSFISCEHNVADVAQEAYRKDSLVLNSTFLCLSNSRLHHSQGTSILTTTRLQFLYYRGIAMGVFGKFITSCVGPKYRCELL